jgi:hypothetical protein
MKVAFSRSRYISAAKVLAAIASAIALCPFALLGVIFALDSVLGEFRNGQPLSFGLVGFESLVLGAGGIAGTLALALAEILSRGVKISMSVRITLAISLLWGIISVLVIAWWGLRYSSPVGIESWIMVIALAALALLGAHSLAALRIVPK